MSSFASKNAFNVPSSPAISAGEQIKKIGESAGYGIEQLSIASGLTGAEIHAIETRDDKEPSRLARIASALQIPLSVLWAEAGFYVG